MVTSGLPIGGGTLPLAAATPEMDLSEKRGASYVSSCFAIILGIASIADSATVGRSAELDELVYHGAGAALSTATREGAVDRRPSS